MTYLDQAATAAELKREITQALFTDFCERLSGENEHTFTVCGHEVYVRTLADSEFVIFVKGFALRGFRVKVSEVR